MSLHLPDGTVHEPEQPQATPESMLEVIAEAREAAESRVVAASSMIVPYAIRALLDGVPVAKVAETCGFDTTEQPEPQSYDDIFSGMSFFGGSSKPRRVGADAFAHWLGQKFTEYVKELHES